LELLEENANFATNAKHLTAIKGGPLFTKTAMFVTE
jgi:hypothetical protein